MKNKLSKLIVGLTLLTFAITGFGQDTSSSNTELKTAVVSFTQLSISNRNISLAVYPTYAPQIVVNGKKDTLGLGLALFTPVALVPGLANNTVAQHAYVGVRFDYLAHQAFASTVGLGLKGDFQLWGHNVEAFTQASANIPFSGFGVQNGELGAAIGGGLYTDIWKFKNGSLGVEISAEKWTQFQGEIFHGGPVLTISF